MPPDSFWHQTPRTVRFALEGYQERIYKLHEVAGNKVKRPTKPIAEQNSDQMIATMDAWVAATQRRAAALAQPKAKETANAG